MPAFVEDLCYQGILLFLAFSIIASDAEAQWFTAESIHANDKYLTVVQDLSLQYKLESLSPEDQNEEHHKLENGKAGRYKDLCQEVWPMVGVEVWDIGGVAQRDWGYSVSRTLKRK